MGVTIFEHAPGHLLRPFVEFPHHLYRDDPVWIPPLRLEVTQRLTPGKNPFFDHAEVALFTARRDGQVVGRISAQIDHEHLRRHRDGTGFFGFFDTVNDAEVATTLLRHAGTWLERRGMRAMRGPLSLSINEEVGVLVDGFDTPPSMMMPHHRPYQGALIQHAGLHPARDLLAWWYRVAPPNPRSARARQTIERLPDVHFRSIDMSRYRHEIGTALDIFNDAWHQNWGFVPPTEAEAEKLASDLRFVLDPVLSFFVEAQGRAIAMVICLPNINEVIRDFNGRLTPVTLFKLWWRLKVQKPRTARVMMLGIREDVRRHRDYAPLSTALYAEITRRGVDLGYQWAELSWTLEDNRPINIGIEKMGARLYKRYRLYERKLGTP